MFWAIHKVHHSAEALSPFTAARGHPLDTLLGIAVGLVSRTLEHRT
jgi:sterol desaturase/sphingolipid hydroxylase (fatty acid hydroxylase superfamily)